MQDPGQEEPGCLGEIRLSPPLADGQQITACTFSRFFQFILDPWKEAVLACRHSRNEIIQHFSQPIEVILIDILDGREECQYLTQGFPEYRMTVIQTIKPKQSVSPSAHRQQGRFISLYGEALQSDSAFAVWLAGCVTGGHRAFVRGSASDSQFDRHSPGRAQNLRHPAREPVRVQFEDELHLSIPIASVHVLPKASEIDRFTADPGSPGIEIPRLDRVMGKRQGMQNARFSRAVGAVDQRDRSQRHTLRGAESLEIGNLESADSFHRRYASRLTSGPFRAIHETPGLAVVCRRSALIEPPPRE